ncbi:MAG: PKD domain-containing protein, partial [Thermoplasmata archaeon]
SSPVPITVIANAAPLLGELIDMDVLVDGEATFTVSPFDPEGDEMSIWWDFGDGSDMAEGTTVTHSYDAVGEYVYRVYVNDNHGHNVTKAAIVFVFDPSTNLPPEIIVLEDKTELVHAQITFNVTASDPNDDVLTCTWDFGDDSDSVVGQTVEHAYEAVGEYTFTVHVDDGEFNETSSATITVNASEPPVAHAGVNRRVWVDTNVAFNGAWSSDDVGVVNYTWTFTYSGSAVTLYGVSPEHMFAVAGSYNVTLTVKDAEDQTATDSVLITVEGDEKTFLESYGLPLGILLAVIVIALVALFAMKGRKGRKAAESVETEGLTSEAPEVTLPEEPPPPSAEGQ